VTYSRRPGPVEAPLYFTRAASERSAPGAGFPSFPSSPGSLSTPASASLSENLWAAGPDTFAGNCEHGNSEKVYRVAARILFVTGTRGYRRRNFVTPVADGPAAERSTGIALG